MKRTLTILLLATLLLTGCAVPSLDFSGVVRVYSEAGSGSGAVVALEDGNYLIATAAHVVQFDLEPLVGENVGRVVAIDYDRDVAIVRVPDAGQNYCVRRLTEAVQGADVTALGWNYRDRHTASLVCYKGNVVTLEWQDPPGRIAVNCGGFPGMSGGPVVDSHGGCIGLLVSCASAWGHPMDSTALIVPSEVIRRLMDETEIGRK